MSNSSLLLFAFLLYQAGKLVATQLQHYVDCSVQHVVCTGGTFKEGGKHRAAISSPSTLYTLLSLPRTQ